MRFPVPFVMFPFALVACVGPAVDPGQFAGNPQLFPAGCTESADLVCFVSEPVTYVPAATGLMWQTSAYDETSRPIGTTNGASIPRAMWDIIGTPYTPGFIRPAILHDHYTWPENRVRPWRETHRAFLYALLDEGVEPQKAYLMYYAVYTFGGHWAELVLPENCDGRCDYIEAPQTALTGTVTLSRDPLINGSYTLADFDGARVDELESGTSDAAAEDLLAVWEILQARNDIVTDDLEETLGNLEDLARARHPMNFFLQYGDRIPLTRAIAECLGLIPGGEHLLENAAITL